MVCAQRPRVLNDVTKPEVLATGASWTVHHRHDEILDFLRREVDEGGDSNYTPVKVLDLESIVFEQDCVAYRAHYISVCLACAQECWLCLERALEVDTMTTRIALIYIACRPLSLPRHTFGVFTVGSSRFRIWRGDCSARRGSKPVRDEALKSHERTGNIF